MFLKPLRTEPPDDRRKPDDGFIGSDGYHEARDFPLKNIPDFQDKISKRG